MKVDDMVAVVTGGARGIGAQIVLELLDRNCRVIIADIDEMKANLYLNDLMDKGWGEDKAKLIVCDVRDQDALNNMLTDAKAWKGRLDIIVNCAGIFNKTTDRARTWVQTKLCAVIDSTYKGIELMSKKNGGSGGVVVNISAKSGLNIVKGIPAFTTACETGVVVFTRAMALHSADEDHGVRFNCVCPSNVETASASYHWDRRPSSQAVVCRDGTVPVGVVVKAVIQALDKNGVVYDVSKDDEIVAV